MSSALRRMRGGAGALRGALSSSAFSAPQGSPSLVLLVARTRGFSAAAPPDNDLVVVGGGPGGYVAAIKAAQLGLRVTCVEKRGTLGGTCLNVGCIPSKALLHSSQMYDQARKDFAKHGVVVENVRVDIEKMMAHKMTAVSGLTKGIEGLFKKNKVKYVKGAGSLTSTPGVVQVAGLDGSTSLHTTKSILLATGSEVMALPGVTIDEQRIVSSTGALSLTEVPKKLVVIGGGVIGLELGSVWARLGSEVTVVEFAPTLLNVMDDEARRAFQKTLVRLGMKFRFGTKVTGAEYDGASVKVKVAPAAGGDTEIIDADVVLVAIGRKPHTTSLGLEAAGVKTDKAGRVVIDSHTFATSAPGVFAIGDIVAGPMLAHKAEEEGIACVEQLAGKPGHVNYDTIPSIIYTHPEVAWVGKTEEQVKADGTPYSVGKFPFMANSRARTNDDADGLVKFITHKETNQILGAHIVGPSAGELLAEVVLAMEYGGSAEDIARTCHGHPTLSEGVKEAAMATFGKPIHF